MRFRSLRQVVQMVTHIAPFVVISFVCLIFMSSVPYWFVMLFAVLLIVLFPGIANWLPNLLM